MTFSWRKVGVVLLFIMTLKSVTSQKIVIVGSGLSGYAAAAKLIENGLKDIIILEAEGRMGGRINSFEIESGKFIDFGAQWVHGEKYNSIYEMIDHDFAFGSSKFDDLDLSYLSSSGNSDDVDTEHLNALLLLVEKISHSYSAMRKFNGSLGDFMISEFKKQVAKPVFSAVSEETKQQALEFAEKGTLATEAASSWLDVSPKLTVTSGEAEGDQYCTWKTAGFKTVFDYISEKLPNPHKQLDIGNKIQYLKEVTNIKWYPLEKDTKIEIKCGDGSKYEADHVIFTPSVGVLKARYAELFTPNLPAEKIKAIENTGFGTLDKIFIEYDTPFWPKNDKKFGSYAFIWKKSDLDAVKGTQRAWLVDVPQFIKVDSYPNLMEAFVVGKNLNQFETISDEQLMNDVIWLFEKFLGKKIEKPKRIFRTKWQTSKNFLGSYSYFSMDAQKAKSTPAADLRKPLKDAGGSPKILFAGEATHDEFSSFANGAVSSGWDVGQNLADYLKD